MDKLMFRKIPLYDLIDVLHRIYDDGADYIDISGKHSSTKDEIVIFVRDDYFYQPEEEENKKLTDDDLNQLIT